MTARDDGRPERIVFSDLAAKRYGAGWDGGADAAPARGRAVAIGLVIVENLAEQASDAARSLSRGQILADGSVSLDLVDREVIDRIIALQ